MFPGMTQRKIIPYIAVAAVVVLTVAALIFFRGARQQPPVQQQTKEQAEKTATQKLLETDPVDPQHMTNLKYIQTGLEKYYNDHRTYPKKLEELAPTYVRVLPKFSVTGTASVDYFYAYYPKDKPNVYHLGALLGGRNAQDAQAFRDDADFNSEKAGYTGGFNGMDPVYDIVGGKK